MEHALQVKILKQLMQQLDEGKNIDAGVQYTINKVGGMKSFLVGGEGLVMNFTGQGNVWIQTRNVGSLAAKLVPFLPNRGS